MKERLELFAKWLQKTTVDFDERDGALESAVKNEREKTIQEIGGLLEEILNLDMETVINELK
tara:strand:- start:261 stop:446 length:186 start_codon:yes stop_codon:yes gene_type:complete